MTDFAGYCWSFHRRPGPVPVQLCSSSFEILTTLKEGQLCSRSLVSSVNLSRLKQTGFLTKAAWLAIIKTRYTFSCFIQGVDSWEITVLLSKVQCAQVGQFLPQNSIRDCIWSVTNLYWKWPNSSSMTYELNKLKWGFIGMVKDQLDAKFQVLFQKQRN